MQRREFLKQAAVGGAALAGGGSALSGAGPASSDGGSSTAQDPTNENPSGGKGFKLKYAPHLGMFKNLAGQDPDKQIDFMAEQGFTAFEDNGMRTRSIQGQERIAAALQRNGMEMGVFVANSNGFGQRSFTSGREEMQEQFLDDLRVSVEVAKRVNARWMTVVMGDLHPRLPEEFQAANAIEALKRGAEIFEPHGLVMVLEPLNPYRDHPGMYLQRIPQAYMLCKAVDSPACKILFDIYHQQITEGNILPNIDRSWDEIGYFQIGDTPGRKEPTTGELNYQNIFKHIHGKGYEGILGMEHGNSKPGRAGENAVLNAYRRCDNFS